MKMKTKKQTEIPDAYYYNGRRKQWIEEHIAHRSIQRPTKELVCFWRDQWEETEGYPEQEAALNKLFLDVFPGNSELNDILIKVCTLNDFYSTNIYKVIDVAKVIKSMEIDTALQSDAAQPEVVDELNKRVYEKTGRHIYSFATKYFSHHQPTKYPIYDSYVDKLLRYFRDRDHFSDFSDGALLSYVGFCEVINQFINHYELDEFTVKDIDKMLWQMGKRHFPKYKAAE